MPIAWKKSQMNKAPIILAVDTSDLKVAIAWVKATEGLIPVYKLGLEFFLTFGSSGVKAIQDETDSDIFLDLKLHDIPHTVIGATKAINDLAPKFLTVHASGGAAMIRAAADAIPDSFITGVTILTSLGDSDVKSIGYAEPALESAVGLAKLAVASGARAIVCSPLEITAIRKAIGLGPIIITPGVRPAGVGKTDDQVRTMTPLDAISAGASLVVIGRPITQNWIDGSSAMREAAAEIAAQLLISE
jgi:orotidine-5'-phosphate decarboxylase